MDPTTNENDIAAWNHHIREVVDVVAASFESLTMQLKAIYGPVASTRRRPRRIQRKIDKRRGRRSYPAGIWRRRGHDSQAGT